MLLVFVFTYNIFAGECTDGEREITEREITGVRAVDMANKEMRVD